MPGLPRIAALIGFALCLPCWQNLSAQGLEDRRVGLDLGYTFVDGPDVSTGSSRIGYSGGHLGVYVTQTRWLRWTGDVTVTENGGILGAAKLYALAGPEFTKRLEGATFFGHALFGYGDTEGSGFFSPHRSGFAMGFGGGVDVKLNSRFSLRAIEVDYLPGRFTGPPYVSIFASPPGPKITTWENNVRVAAGIILKFGHKPS